MRAAGGSGDKREKKILTDGDMDGRKTSRAMRDANYPAHAARLEAAPLFHKISREFITPT